MGQREDLENYVADTFRTSWSYVDARVVPETKSIPLGNSGKELFATVLYADIDASTHLVEAHTAEFAAEVYKCFLYCASRLISSHGGSIRSFDGDRVMGVFQGDGAEDCAVKVGLKLNWSVRNIINPGLAKIYHHYEYRLRHTVGVDCSEVLAVRAGIRDSNDLSWIGSAPNIAAKLNTLSSDYPTWITHRIFDRLSSNTKFGGSPPKFMWEEMTWTSMDNLRIYRSNWSWKI